jgi:trigger factor
VDAETCKRELVIEIPADIVRRDTDTVTDQYRRVARIPGFRPGKAPSGLVQKHFRENIRDEILQSLVPKYFEDTVKGQKMSVIGRPQFDELKFEDGQPVTFKATFEILPEFELGNYRGLEVEEEPAAVTEADLEKAIEQFREQAAVFEPVEGRGAEDGDEVFVNYRGLPTETGPESRGAAPVESREATVHLGDRQTVPAFTENLRGAKAGEKREFDAAYPDDYPQKSLAGKTLHYAVEVVSVKKKVVPPADDELAKSVSEFQTLEELKAHLRENLAQRKQRQVEAETKRKLLDRLIDAQAFPVPGVLVEAKLDDKLERMVGQLLTQGMDPRTLGVDWHKIREDSRPDAEREARASLILGEIAKAEKIEVSEDELDELIRNLAAEGHEAPAVMKTRLTREGRLDTLKSTRRAQKALDFIYRNAIIQRKEPTPPAPAEG